MRPRPQLYCMITFDFYLLFLTFSTEMTTWHMTGSHHGCKLPYNSDLKRIFSQQWNVLFSYRPMLSVHFPTRKCKSLLLSPVNLKLGARKFLSQTTGVNEVFFPETE